MDEDIANIDGYNVSLRKTRQGSECSMSSQRLDEIVGALMKPIKGLKQNFDMDINSLLEEYLTEAGLRQLDEGRCPIDDTLPNFAEVALLLQQSANIYSKKVDYLWIKVVEIVQSFGSSREDVNDLGESEEVEKDERKSSKKSKRKEVEIRDFDFIDLDEATNINLKENSDPKPLAVLPKNFIEFEPRVITENDIQIKDYKGDLIGVSTDFRCNWNTDQDGMLCDDLEYCDDKEPLDMCAIEITATAISSPPDSGHCSDYTDCHNSTTPINLDSDYACNETFTSPHSEREYGDLSSILENTENRDTTVAESTLLNETADTTLQNTILEGEAETSKKRKISDGTQPTKRKSSKYDAQHCIAGTAHLINSQPSIFELPKAMLMSVLERRKNKLRKIRKKMSKYDVSERTLDTQYFLDSFVANSYGKRTTLWYRRQMLNELKVLATEWDKDFLGFPDYDSKEDRNGFIGFDDEVTARLQRHYSRNQILYSAAIARASENPADETAEYNDYDSTDHHHQEDSHEPDANEDAREPAEDPERADAITQRLTSEAILQKNNLICSKEQLEISQRVEEWHTSIRADLIKAERRKMFDLWSYSSKVLTSFSTNKGDPKPVISFSHVMKDKPKEDTARYFLATLMLANSQNVEILPKDTHECGDFDMHLLSMERRIVEDEDLFC